MAHIEIENEIYPVVKFKKGKKEGFKAGVAYSKNGICYPFRGKFKKKVSSKIGVYYDKEKEPMLLMPIKKKDAAKYSEKNIFTMDTIEDILEIVGSNTSTTDNIDILMGETDEVFAPVISDKDNCLQALIKYALQNKQIDLKHYKPRFIDPADLSNHRKGILKHGKMSMEKLIKWAQVLDLDYEIIIKDKPNCPNPMNKIISFSSIDGFEFKDK